MSSVSGVVDPPRERLQNDIIFSREKVETPEFQALGLEQQAEAQNKAGLGIFYGA